MGGGAVNRWRQRLAELHGDTADLVLPPSRLVQNVQNVQNTEPSTPSEHIEQIEQSAELPEAAATDRAFVTWGEREAERAAIVEHDGAIPREWAEGFARLDP